MIEADVEIYLCRRVREAGGQTRKVRWISRRGAPDRLLMLPCLGVLWVETKRPKGRPDSTQLQEHDMLRRYGERVEVIDTIEKVDLLMREEEHTKARQRFCSV